MSKLVFFALAFAGAFSVQAIEFSIGPANSTPSNGKALECEQTGGWTIGNPFGTSASFGGDRKCKEIEQPQSLEEGVDLFKEKIGSVFSNIGLGN